ncbi:MAG: PD-(D/E)XK nuclease family protein [Anaerolineae bacterium CG_4_9_14_0_8_um_filter_58_9]|nr:MAG: PD-(D/E)XK nuclease family protein [Anaerolineae bacterium CG_4_9_14_0_8_um_filter_58_9]
MQSTIVNLKSQIESPFTFSQSSLQDYADCPRRFQLRYIEQLAWPAVETEPALENERRQQEGLLFHRLAQQHLIGLPAEKLARLANTPDLNRWWDNYLASDLRGLKDLGGLYPELTLSAPLGEHRLLAKYDLIAVQSDKKAFIYDWKTYRKRPRDEWMAARLQTRVYRALLIQAGAHLNKQTRFQPEQIEMIYWYADFPAEPARFPYTAAQYKRDWDTLTGLIAEIAARRNFPLTADEEKCAYCPYRSYCERGAEAGILEEMGEETELESIEVNFEQIQEIEF